MNFDDQIRRYFGVPNLASVPPEAFNAGIEHMKVDLGLTKDRGERFALWALLHTLGSAPAPKAPGSAYTAAEVHAFRRTYALLPH
jgi:hypothetical protein